MTDSQRIYLFLSSSDSLNIYPRNTACDFIVELPHIINLAGKWDVALSELYYTTSGRLDDEYLLVYCDLCDDSYVYNSFAPILRRLPARRIPVLELSNFYFMPVKTNYIKQIRIHIRDEHGNIPSFIKQPLTCTLILRQQ
jgi:hypothetical protein